MKSASKNKSHIFSNTGVHKGNSKQEVESEDSSSNSLPNEDLLFTIPCPLPKQRSVIGPTEYKIILNVIQLQQDVISTRPKFAAAHVKHFLNFHMNLLELVPKHLSENPVQSEIENSAKRIDNATVSGDIKAEQITLSLHSSDLNFLNVSSINLINSMIKVAKQARVFSFWYAFFPGATISPFKLGMFDLLTHTSEEVRLSNSK